LIFNRLTNGQSHRQSKTKLLVTARLQSLEVMFVMQFVDVATRAVAYRDLSRDKVAGVTWV